MFCLRARTNYIERGQLERNHVYGTSRILNKNCLVNLRTYQLKNESRGRKIRKISNEVIVLSKKQH